MWNATTRRAAFALAAIALTTAGCNDGQSPDATAPIADFNHTNPGTTPVVYEQTDFLGNPLVSEVTIAKANHEAYNKTQPYNTATFLPQSAAFITSFGRPLSLAQTLGGVLYPDILIVDTSKDPATAGWLSWALAGGWGGRKLADDVVDVGLSAIFSSLLEKEGAKCAPFELPLCTDNVAGNDREFAASFPYLASPNTALPMPTRPDPDGPGNAAPVIDGLRADPAAGPYPVTAKSCGGRFTVCVRFQVTDADGSSDTPAKVVVDWGDGTSWAPNNVPMATPLLAPHDYANPGTYTVRVTATDRRGAAATPVTLTLQVTGAGADPRRASLIHDATGDFLASYTGPKGADLDVVEAEVTYTGSTFVLTSMQAGAVGTTAGGFYVWGIDRGRGTSRFPDIAPGVRFDAVVIVRPDGTGTVTDLTSGAAPVSTPLPAGSVVISGSRITATVAAALLPTQGAAPAAYTANLWPRLAGTTAAISDFAPDNRNAPVGVTR